MAGKHSCRFTFCFTVGLKWQMAGFKFNFVLHHKKKLQNGFLSDIKNTAWK
jgi:hypothetical protein